MQFVKTNLWKYKILFTFHSSLFLQINVIYHLNCHDMKVKMLVFIWIQVPMLSVHAKLWCPWPNGERRNIYVRPFSLSLSLSLSLVKYSVLNLFLVLAHMQFPILDHYMHTSRHRKATIRSKWTFYCVCSYVCNENIGNIQILMCHWFWQDLSMSMKIPNFRYKHSCQTSFHCCNVAFVFVMGNQFLHIYVEVIICIRFLCYLESTQCQLLLQWLQREFGSKVMVCIISLAQDIRYLDKTGELNLCLTF